MYSHTVSNFYINKNSTIKKEYELKPVFNTFSYDILQFLNKKDIKNLKSANKFFFEICECHLLLSESIKGLNTLFSNSLLDETTNQQKKSKFKEKYNFNKSMNEFYKGSEILSNRIKSAKKK
jgi:hypothetical protein